MTVGVVVDGGVSLPDHGLASLHVVPMHVGAARVRRAGAGAGAGAGMDGTGTNEAGAPGTSAPTPGDFLAAIESADDGDGVVVVTVAAKLSASYAAARLALAEGPAEARLVDSTSATAGEGLVAMAASAAAAKGASLDEVQEAATRAARAVRLVAQITSLDRLAAGGRLPAVAASGARRVSMRPVFELSRGSIRPLLPAIGERAAEERVLASLRRSARDGAARGRLHVAALHAAAPESAARLLQAAREVAAPETSFVAELSPVMLAHTGEGVSGLAWWWG